MTGVEFTAEARLSSKFRKEMQWMGLIHRVSERVYRGPRPRGFEDIKNLAASGVKTVVNLESGIFSAVLGKLNHEYRWCAEVGIDLIEYRLSPILPPSRFDLHVIRQIISQSTDRGSVYVHCKDGVDRTGLVIADWLIRKHLWDYAAAVRDMYARGFHRWRYWWWELLFRGYYK